MAEAVFRHHTQNPEKPHPLIGCVDSAGTGAWHIGCNPDPRTTATLDSNGIDNYEHAARQVRESDFDDFHYILAMDRENVTNLKFMKNRILHRRGGKEDGLAHVGLFGDYGSKRGTKGEEIDDPYYGGDQGFAKAYEQSGRFTAAFLKMIEEQEGGKL